MVLFCLPLAVCEPSSATQLTEPNSHYYNSTRAKNTCYLHNHSNIETARGVHIQLLAVFDGHGGRQASQLAADRVKPLFLRRLHELDAAGAPSWTELKKRVAEALGAALRGIEDEFDKV